MHQIKLTTRCSQPSATLHYRSLIRYIQFPFSFFQFHLTFNTAFSIKWLASCWICNSCSFLSIPELSLQVSYKSCWLYGWTLTTEFLAVMLLFSFGAFQAKKQGWSQKQGSKTMVVPSKPSQERVSNKELAS